MNTENIIELHGCVSLIDLPDFEATPVQLFITVSRPGTSRLSSALSYCVLQYSGSPVPYQLLLDCRAFDAGEPLELEAFINAGYGQHAEKVRVTVPVSLDHDTSRVEHNLILEGAAPDGAKQPGSPAFTRFGGTLSIPEVGDLSDHLLSVALYEVRELVDQAKHYNRIAENSYQVRELAVPFSLTYDKQVLSTQGTTHELQLLLRAPSGKFVAGRTLRNVVLADLDRNLHIELKPASA